MLRQSLTREAGGTLPGRVLMTVDAVGGVWRYAVDAARGLTARGVDVLLVGLGPTPSTAQQAEVGAIARVSLEWLDEPLDWMVERESDLDGLPARLQELVDSNRIDLVQVNAPSQAAGLFLPVPLIAMSHSCVVTWWEAVRGGTLPPEWSWQRNRNRRGFDAADLILAPSHSHATALAVSYSQIGDIEVVPNAISPRPAPEPKQPFVFSAARWWDPGKNAEVLDQAAAHTRWPVVMAGATEGPNGDAVRIQNAEAVGVLSGSEVRSRMAEAEIVACPSLYEPFGLVALEAASAGAALVLADIPTFRELWADTAVFADPGDPGAFAAAINALAADQTERRRLADAAAKRSRRYAPERQIDGLLSTYGRAMMQRSARMARAVADLQAAG